MKPSIEIKRNSSTQPWTYSQLDTRQREIAEAVRNGEPGALLLSEVSPVITVGRRTAPGDILLGRESLEKKGIQIFPTDRGGLATYHGPGQWVVFPVDHLSRLTGDSRGIRKAVEGLLTLAQTVALKYVGKAEIKGGTETGVWTSRGKIAAVGLHVERGIVHHGLAINVFKTETSFMGLRPCGLDAPVDFLFSQKTPQDFDFQQEFNRVGESIQDVALEIFWEVSR